MQEALSSETKISELRCSSFIKRSDKSFTLELIPLETISPFPTTKFAFSPSNCGLMDEPPFWLKLSNNLSKSSTFFCEITDIAP